MSLTPGTRLGPYEITAPLGAGGMGEVYRATDTKLNRDVAIKVLPDTFAEDPERLARFQREAQVLASLNHPNIGHIYGLEESDGSQALVLELVEGPTLADRISQGAIPLDDALPIAKQIAEALEAAHERGIIHRDLKPANIKVTPEGVVKVLDFGLAKALEPKVSDADVVNSPTMTAAATRAGIIMGTAAYMSPEQARGKAVDRRADIWAFGVVLYEMLAGRRVFEGEDVSLTLADVMRAEPHWEALPSETPPAVRNVLKRCLEKDPRQRVQAIGDVRLAMEGAFETTPSGNVEAVGLSPLAVWQRPMSMFVAAVIAALVTGLAVWSLQPTPDVPSVTRTIVPLPANVQLARRGSSPIALSPDGSRLVYAAGVEIQLYVRPLDQADAQAIPGTEGAHTPFFSPDGQWVGFFTGNALKKVALAGGTPLTLFDTSGSQSRGGSWGPDDAIVFAPTNPGIRLRCQ